MKQFYIILQYGSNIECKLCKNIFPATKFNNHLPKKREDLFTKSPEELTNLHKIEDQDDTHERTLGKKYVDFPNSFNSEYGKGNKKII